MKYWIIKRSEEGYQHDRDEIQSIILKLSDRFKDISSELQPKDKVVFLSLQTGKFYTLAKINAPCKIVRNDNDPKIFKLEISIKQIDVLGDQELDESDMNRKINLLPRKEKTSENVSYDQIKEISGKEFNEIKEKIKTRARSFETVKKDEIEEINFVRTNKAKLFPEEDLSNADQFFGLALSGGGIRSATFNLGILQGLAEYRILPRIDYLSTVSGGGYIGTWFTTWIKHCGLKDVIKYLAASSEKTVGTEPKPVSYLRQFSNYLTPKVGLLNSDTLTAAVIYLRNLFLNLIILTTLLGAFVLLPKLISFTIERIQYLRTFAPSLDLSFHAGYLFLIALLLAYVAVIFTFKNLNSLKNTGNDPLKFYNTPTFIKLGIVLMLFLTCMLITISIKAAPELWQSPWNIPLMVAAALILNPFLWKKKENFPEPQLYLILPTILGAFCVWGLSFNKFSSNIWMVFGTPLLLAVFSVCGSLYIGLMGRLFDSGTREWLSRLGAWILIAIISYSVLCGISIYGPVLVEKAYLNYLKTGLLSGWLITTIGGVLTGKRQLIGGKKSSLLAKILTGIAPYVFILGLLILLSWACDLLYDIFINEKMTLLKGGGSIFAGILAFFAVAIVLSWRVDVNAFSMHNFYRNRLIRCYIGASDDNRNQNLWTGFDMREHCVRLCEMANTFEKSPRKSECPPEKETAYQGPYHIVNSTLNLVSGENLAWQKRKAKSFIMSPLFCGYDVRPNEHIEKVKSSNNITSVSPPLRSEKLESSGYRLTNLYAKDISSGTAMAISGAAVSPSMGHYSSTAVAFLMTIFNVRLGQWLGNPRYRYWKEAGPRIGLIYLFWELFSMTNDQRGYVYLSDGGHFDNLGLYELVRRRCRYIIVCDAGQDEAMKFNELGAAIEKCRTDFGIDIDIKVDPIRLAKNREFSGAHCVVGKIKYDQLGPEETHGFLIYIKASLTGDEPTDIIGYAAQNEKFPHQSTADQWFDESQFESYRSLGQHIAKSVFESLGNPEDISRWNNELIFVELSKHWYPPSVAVAKTFTKHSATLANLYGQISKQDDLKFLDAQLVAEWEQLSQRAHIKSDYNYWIPYTENELRAGFYMIYQMIQLMENVYIDLNLEEEHDHPDNRGWMNIFRTWSWSGMFRVGWAVSAGTFGARFQSFCKRHLDLDVGKIEVGKEQLLEIEDEERKKCFSELKQKRELNFVEENFLKKFIKTLATPYESYFPLEYYPLKIKVCLPKRNKQLSFHFGFALMSHKFESDQDIKKQYSDSKYLLYFRIQDHVRKMGFGRTSLVKLLRHHKKNHIFIKISDLKLFPVDDERKKFEILFDSVQKGIDLV